jgi:hypothetical protein
VSNILSKDKQQQLIAGGRLEWSLRRIERETRVWRETAAAYLRMAGIAVGTPRARGQGVHRQNRPMKLTTWSGPVAASSSAPIRSSCEPFRDFIE